MTFKKIVSELCRREGKKIGVSVAQMSEIVRCLGDMLNEPDADRYAIVHAIENHELHRRVAEYASRVGLLIPKPKPRAKRKARK